MYLCTFGGEKNPLVQKTDSEKADFTVFKDGDLENEVTLKIRSRSPKLYQLFILPQ